MKKIVPILSWLALLALVLPAGVYLVTGRNLPAVKTVMVLATVLWFLAGSVWLWNKE